MLYKFILDWHGMDRSIAVATFDDILCVCVVFLMNEILKCQFEMTFFKRLVLNELLKTAYY